jgi:2'-5' RNA ligase
MDGTEVRRLFLALWPETAVRGAIADLQQRFPPGIGRAVPAGNLHLTLVFLGATPAARRQCLEQAVGEIRVAPFDLRLDRLGWWRRPQVLWAGSASTPPALRELVQALQERVVRCGGEVEMRPFEVHLTLFRKVRKPPPPLPSVTPTQWRVQAFALVESITAAAGADYRVLRQWPLGGSTSP